MGLIDDSKLHKRLDSMQYASTSTKIPREASSCRLLCSEALEVLIRGWELRTCKIARFNNPKLGALGYLSPINARLFTPHLLRVNNRSLVLTTVETTSQEANKTLVMKADNTADTLLVKSDPANIGLAAVLTSHSI